MTTTTVTKLPVIKEDVGALKMRIKEVNEKLNDLI
jgi:hypothetical protein